jgi:hypothetical protein
MHLCPIVVIYSTHALQSASICNLLHKDEKTTREGWTEAILAVLAWGGGLEERIGAWSYMNEPLGSCFTYHSTRIPTGSGLSRQNTFLRSTLKIMLSRFLLRQFCNCNEGWR